ncbi:MAG: META domain-containing protein [Candidatus Baltobacteraceae bacterium]
MLEPSSSSRRNPALARAAAAIFGSMLLLAAEPAPAPNLANTSWQLVEIENADGTKLQPADPIAYTIAFAPNGGVSVRLDCNRGHGSWKVSAPNKIEFGPMALTMALCPEGTFSDRIAHDWQTISSYAVEDGRLRLNPATGGAYVFEPSLANTSWQLEQIENADGTTVKPNDPAKYTLAFDGDGNVNLQLDCNRGRATWKVTAPNGIAFGPMAMTRAMCPPGSLSDRIAKDWESIHAYAIEQGALRLQLSGGGAYDLKPATLPSGA